MDERRSRITALLGDLGADWAILTAPDTICYATGHPVPIEWGPSPFAGGTSVALVGRDGSAGLAMPNHELTESPEGVEVMGYVGFSYDAPADLRANWRAAVVDLVRRLGVGGQIAVEPGSFTAELGDLLAPVRTIEIGPALRDARATKTAGEIAALTHAAATAAAGQDAARAASRPGRTELSAFAEIRAAIENVASARCPMAGDYVSGVERAAGGMGWPNTRVLEPGDPVVCDLAPRVAGYWGDSCSSFVLGPPPADWTALFERSKAALGRAMEIMRPGLPVSRLDAELRGMVERDGVVCHHHMGHGIGTSVHEWPRLIPGEEALLREDMVLMVEPGGYRPGTGGVRLEWMLRITPTGAVPLAPFEHRPSAQGEP